MRVLLGAGRVVDRRVCTRCRAAGRKGYAGGLTYTTHELIYSTWKF
jgi:hypothetical protein